MKFEPVLQRSRPDLELMLKSENPETIADALVSATYHDPEWRWVQDRCLEMLHHGDVHVRRTAATCLGDLAVFHRDLDLQSVLPALDAALLDPDLRSAVDDSLDLIKQNVHGREQ